MRGEKRRRKILSVALSFLLAAYVQVGYGYQAQPEPQGGNEAAPKGPADLQALVAPIALYPDALVAQVLSAATFPDQVAAAQGWLQEHKSLTGNQLMQEIDKQPWDPSVKALGAFPSVLDNMAQNLAWTSALGEAYHYQPNDVMAAVQALRAKAKAAGNLKSSSQITVVEQSPSTIVIQPANPQVIYVPQYNPTVIYGTPVTTPGYSAGTVAAASVISFGAGIAIGAMMSGGCCNTWGWNAWNVNWHGGTVVYNRNVYYGNAAWHGASGAYGYHGYGAYQGASYHGPGGSAAAYRGYTPNGNYHTGGAYSNAYGAGTQHTTYGRDGAVHTGGSGYNRSTGQSYQAGATKTAAGGTMGHAVTGSGQAVVGGTTAGGQHWGGTNSGNGWSTQAASSRGHATMAARGRR